ncbi:muscle-derived protein (neurite-outgrowth-promoting) [Teratosphaeria destructans]|uniref:Muscle-derived protein (Neurite-outgrowth-promoting) n=1 Tax=Teratosphaeria destructans TaxID=418781 RepID=A0A9W7W610_9PEZI|nr:muscle-derived protein (neurite-outgrowth-promoting) [Teratosphaeria destructans]
MAAVANQQPLPSNTARNSPASMDYSDASLSAPPPPPSTAPAAAKSNKKNKKGPATNNNDPNDAHKALLSKISQLEQSSTETAHETAEIEAEVRKANRELTSMLNTLEPHNNRLDVLQRKFTELLADMKRVEREHTKAKKRGDQLQKEKEEIAKERTKERGLKEKLEKLSRELTRENKRLKEEVKDLRESSADRNEELHRKLEGMVMDVEEVVADRRSPERQAVEMEQDKMFREKFTSFLHQYELRELQFHSLMRMKDLEIAYQTARHDQLKKAQESELSKSHQLTRQVSTFSQTENELRGQLNVYVEKFKQQVEDTLNNSNDLFLTFRKEMEEMSKKTKRLEKENLNLTRKQEATNKNIFQMAEERSQSQQTIDRLTRENEKLKKLCRAMQQGSYGAASGVAGAQVAEGAVDEYADEMEGETESEYEDEYDEDEDEEGEYEDDTEEEGIEVPPRTFGPPPPPPPQQEGAVAVNGKPKGAQAQAQVNGVNGVRH